MRFTTNPLFATGGWIASSAMICPCQGRRGVFYHLGDIVDRDEFRMSSNSLPVGVS
jgi:hypothetical protein